MANRTLARYRVLFGVLLACVALLSGCVGSVADRMTTGPNALRTLQQLRDAAPEPEVPGTVIDHAFHVSVDARGTDRAAHIAVWVIEPTDQQVRLTDGGRQLEVTEPASGDPVTARGTVLILHGLWHHKAKRIYVLWARLLASDGYRCVLVDSRSHGQSTGTKVSYGVHEAADTLQVIDALEQRNLIEGELGILGGSMGAATAIQTAAQDERIDTVICLAPFSRLDEVIGSVARAVFFSARLMPGVVWDRYAAAVGKRVGIDPAQADNIEAARRVKAPMLLIAAGDDDLVPPEQARAIHAVAPDGSRLHIIEGEDHRSIARAVPEPMLALVLDWLNERVAAR